MEILFPHVRPAFGFAHSEKDSKHLQILVFFTVLVRIEAGYVVWYDKSPWTSTNEDDKRAETAFGWALNEDRVEPWVMTYGGPPLMEDPIDAGQSSWPTTRGQTVLILPSAGGQANRSSCELDSSSEMPGMMSAGALTRIQIQILVAFTTAPSQSQAGSSIRALDFMPVIASPAYGANGAFYGAPVQSTTSSYDASMGSIEARHEIDENIVLRDREDEIINVDMADSFEADWTSSMSPSPSSMPTSLSGHTPALTASSSLAEVPLPPPTPSFNCPGSEEFRCRWNGGWNDGTCNHKVFGRKEQNSDSMAHFLNYHQESTQLEDGCVRCLWCKKRPLISRLGIANHIRKTRGHQLDMEEDWVD